MECIKQFHHVKKKIACQKTVECRKGGNSKEFLDVENMYSNWEGLKWGDDLVFEMFCGQDTSKFK